MQGDIVSGVLLPLILAFIMFSLGLGLTVGDFRRILGQPRALLVGVVCHFVLLPLVCYLMLRTLGVTGVFAVGFMILAACPTGTTSNLLTYLARGDVALALSFTAVAGGLVASSVAVLAQLGQWSPALRPLWTLAHLAALVLGLWLLATPAFGYACGLYGHQLVAALLFAAFALVVLDSPARWGVRGRGLVIGGSRDWSPVRLRAADGPRDISPPPARPRCIAATPCRRSFAATQRRR